MRRINGHFVKGRRGIVLDRALPALDDIWLSDLRSSENKGQC